MKKSNKKINILAPIDSIGEAQPLIDAGADSFYCSFRLDGYNLGSRRNNNPDSYNLSGFSEYKELKELLQSKGKEIFVVINAYNESRVFNLFKKDLLDEIIDTAPNGIIVGNIRHLYYFKKQKNRGNIKIVISSLFEIKNEESAKFAAKEGADSIVLDRQIEINDLHKITKSLPNTEFEAIIFSAGCRSLASACNYNYYFNEHLCACSNFMIHNNCSSKLSTEQLKSIGNRLNMPSDCCGACAFYEFKKFGVNNLKIVGRGLPTSQKIKYISFINKIKALLEETSSQEDFYHLTQKIYKQFFSRSCEKKYCYYPHFFN